MSLMQCRNLRKTYLSGDGEIHAVDGLTLSIAEGSFTAVTGPSGSGKSTLLHMLGGWKPPPRAKSCTKTWTWHS